MIEDAYDLDDKFEDPMIVDNQRTIFIMLSQTNDHFYIITNPHEEINQIEIDMIKIADSQQSHREQQT